MTEQLQETTEREQMADGLIELAEAIRSNPKFPTPDQINLSIYANIWAYDSPDSEETGR